MQYLSYMSYRHKLFHYSVITWASWQLKSSAIWLSVQQPVHNNIKEDIIPTPPCIIGSLRVQSTHGWWIPLTKGQ